MKNIFTKFTVEQNCCTDTIDLDPVDYKIDKEKLQTLQSIYTIKSKKTDESLSECKKKIKKK